MGIEEGGEGIEDDGGVVEGVCEEAVGLCFGDEGGAKGVGAVDGWMELLRYARKG